MKKLLLLILISYIGFNTSIAQITPNGNSGVATTAYTNGSPNNPIYIWCATGLSNNTASLTATPASGTGPFTFNWFYHNQTNSSWIAYTTTSGLTSTISNLVSDGYRVQIYNSSGVLVGCYTAWVWNMNGQVTANNAPTACNAANLSGTVASNGSFTYYNPPPPPALINASTTITVCFSANHTWVSDLGFYLVGPASCGSPTILLSPNPGSNGQGAVCNSGNNVSNLCFSSASTNILNVCTASVPLTGTYGGYGAGAGTLINWSALNGCNAAQGGWRVQIYDCIGADVGALTNANISFSNLTSVCGSPTSINYSSGAINSAINDNSCNPGSASIFQVPVTPGLTAPITINATTTYLWTSNPATTIPNASTSLSPSVTNIPPGSTTFTLTSTVSYGGTSCTYSANTTFVNTCCPTVIVNNTTICAGQSATLTATPTPTGGTYLWSPGGQTTQSIIVSPASTSNYSVVYTLNGCASPSASGTVTVNPSPTVIVNNPTICNGQSTTLTATPSSLGGTYLWSPGGQTTQSIIVSPASTISYSVVYTLAGCPSPLTNGTVTVNPIHTITAASNQTVCQNTALSNITMTIGGGATGATITGLPAGITSSVVGSTVTISGTPTVSGSFPYTVTTTGNACAVATTNATITVNPTPLIDAGIDQSVCDGTSVVLNASGGNTYTWDNGVSNGIAFTPITSATYTITGTSIEGCINSDQVNVTVNPIPVVIAGNNLVLCENQSTIIAGSGAVIYTWNNGVINGASFTPPLGTTVYTVTGTTAAGCTSTDQLSILVNANPNVNFTPDVSAGCTPLTVNFTNLTPNSANCTWYVSNGTTLNGCNTVSTTFNQGGCFNVTLTTTSINGCTSSFTANNLICVEAPPVAAFTTSDIDITTLDTEVDFFNYSTGAIQYEWNFGDNSAISNVTNPSHLYGEIPGSYSVYLVAISPLGCIDTAFAIINISEELLFYIPNTFTPDVDNYNPVFQPIFTSGFDPYDFTLLIYNRWGELIFESHDASIGWNGTYGSNGEVKICQDGSYTWKIEFKTKLNDERKMVVGHVNLLR